MSENKFLEKLTGPWAGICRTWFEPGKLADESEVTGRFEALYGGSFFRHSYVSTIQGKPRQGEDLLAFNTLTKIFQSAWIDDFHMHYAIMFSQGDPTKSGFSVAGDYDVGEDLPRWGWRTVFDLISPDELLITAYNITPGSEEAKAVETH